MFEILERRYWNKSNVFLLPLTGWKKTDEFEVHSYVGWDEYSIENYELVVKINYGHRFDDFQNWMNKENSKEGSTWIKEMYNFEGFSILIFDISLWKDVIECFLAGKYSKIPQDAKDTIEKYHYYYENGIQKINAVVKTCLYPNNKQKELDNMTGLEYAIKNYVFVTHPPTNIDLDTAKAWRDRGELCSLCNLVEESLQLDIEQELNMTE